MSFNGSALENAKVKMMSELFGIRPAPRLNGAWKITTGSHIWIENKTKLTMRQEMVQICMPRGQKVRTMSNGLCHRTEKSSRAFSRLWIFLPKPFNELSMAAYFSRFSCIVFHVFLIIVTYSACHHTHLTDKPMMCFELTKSIFFEGQENNFYF